MISSFADKATAAVFQGEYAKKIPMDIQVRAQRKLEALHAATDVNELRVPPSNYLKALKGDRLGQYSIRINQQWRICFKWIDGNAHDVEMIYFQNKNCKYIDGNAHDVEITDYH